MANSLPQPFTTGWLFPFNDMKESPLVSVIMIFLNAEEFMREAVESVLAQTYPNWELILVNDGSSDDSTEMAREFAKNDQRIRYFEHTGRQNLGMSASRNRGIQQSRGGLIAFLDADDVYLPQKLEQQVSLLQSHPQAAMVYGATQHWFSWTGRAEDAALDHLRKLGASPNTLVQPPCLVTRFLRHEAWTPGTCGVLIRREAVEQVGGFEEQFTGMFEDQAFFYKLCLHTPVYVEAGSWDRYRQHPGSCYYSALRNGLHHPRNPNPSHQKFYRWLRSYLLDQGIYDAALWAALNKELFPYQHPNWYRIFKHSYWLSSFAPLVISSRPQ